jgi:glutamyl-tRNA synthetase
MLHIGGVRTALFSWLYARRFGGKFILRIEDTDRERSTEEAVRVILDGMSWLGLDPDEEPIYQTHRFPRYQQVIGQLLAEGKAYRCYCTKEELEQLRAEQMARKEKPRYDGRWRDRRDVRDGVAPVIRFKNPLDGAVTVRDLVHGDVVFQNKELDDLIIARADGTPTYNFCVVVDDIDMGVTHVIRGDDHLNNTPRQINMFSALGAAVPTFAHVPMILGADGAKLSKRHGAVSVLQYEEDGFLPDALLNYLVRLGWSHGDQEIFTRQEMIDAFDIANVNKAASAFNSEKLLWLNQQHLMRADPASVVPYLRKHLARIGIEGNDDEFLARVIVAQRERVKTIKEMAALSRYFFSATVQIPAELASKHLTEASKSVLRALLADFEALSSWDAQSVHTAIAERATQAGVTLGKVAQPLRVAVTGGTVSPPIDMTVELLGRERTLQRLLAAVS